MLQLTPEVLRAAYAYLGETEPFCRWNLPEPEDVRFIVTRSRSLCGYHDNGRPGARKMILACSSVFIKTTLSLMMTVAHETAHIHQFRYFRTDSEHGPAWNKMADQICKVHGFDRGLF